MSAMSESIRRSKERAAREAAEIEGLIVFTLSALFHTAHLIHNQSQSPSASIREAQRFMEDAKTLRIWPEEPK